MPPKMHEHEADVDEELVRRLLVTQMPGVAAMPLRIVEPAFGSRYRWAVHRWIEGNGASRDRMTAPVDFARDLARVVGELQAMPTVDAPPPRHRARPIAEYDGPTRRAMEAQARRSR